MGYTLPPIAVVPATPAALDETPQATPDTPPQWTEYDLFLNSGVQNLVVRGNGIVLWIDDGTPGATATVQFDQDPYQWQLFPGHKIYKRFKQLTFNAAAQTNAVLNCKWSTHPGVLRLSL
jgi:hypothetical protein